MYARISSRSATDLGDQISEITGPGGACLVVRYAFAAVELRKSVFDLREKHQTLDRVINRRIRRQLLYRLDHLLPGNAV